VTWPNPKRPVDWVFLDRDGTINRKAANGDYVKAPCELSIIPDAAEAIRRLNDAGVWVGIVTNQQGIALGRMTEADFAAVQARLAGELRRVGARIDAVYHCPHLEETCACRKPAPGMLLRARRRNPGLEFEYAAMVGDSAADIAVGRRVGAVTVRIAERVDASRVMQADHVAPSLERAVDWLLSETPGVRRGPGSA
jgi:D-glycero-D-manno-heptose 1,7-bisphosphate phosphatase